MQEGKKRRSLRADMFRMAGDSLTGAQKDQQLTIDSDQLNQEDVSELKGLVAASHIFDLPAIIASHLSDSTTAPVSYTLTVEISGHSHTIWIAEPVENSDLKRLLEYLAAGLVSSVS